ncbi:hypothetical protein TNCV_3326471 [Trichonephila clavipes]|nr:hypothetical protein TNCV_3326471 [Trichonephila clavipes]
MVRLKHVRLVLFDKVTEMPQIVLNCWIGGLKTQPGTTFGFPELASSVAGKRQYGRLPLFSKVTGITNIRFWILVCHPENDNKCTFSVPSLLGRAPVTVGVIDSRSELSSKVVRISHIG